MGGERRICLAAWPRSPSGTGADARTAASIRAVPERRPGEAIHVVKAGQTLAWLSPLFALVLAAGFVFFMLNPGFSAELPWWRLPPRGWADRAVLVLFVGAGLFAIVT